MDNGKEESPVDEQQEFIEEVRNDTRHRTITNYDSDFALMIGKPESKGGPYWRFPLIETKGKKGNRLIVLTPPTKIPFGISRADAKYKYSVGFQFKELPEEFNGFINKLERKICHFLINNQEYCKPLPTMDAADTTLMLTMRDPSLKFSTYNSKYDTKPKSNYTLYAECEMDTERDTPVFNVYDAQGNTMKMADVMLEKSLYGIGYIEPYALRVKKDKSAFKVLWRIHRLDLVPEVKEQDTSMPPLIGDIKLPAQKKQKKQ
jgi:hypothetical protein